MKLAPSLEAFAAAPAGQYMRGDSFLYVCEREDLYAFYLWGKPSGAATKHLIDVLRVEMRPAAQPHRSFVDFSGVTGIEGDAFGLMRDFLDEIKLRQKEVTLREAVVRPGGVAGAIVAGFFALYPQLYPTKVFTDPLEAIAWLDVEAALHRDWCELRSSLNGVPPELAQLRALLAERFRDADVKLAAHALGCSPRTLQRRLRDWGTGFQQELDAVRLGQAQRRLEQTDDKLAAIALDVGFTSPQHFSEWFRQQTGSTADGFRARARTER
jgi:AraC-like DNA-binding protein